MKALVLSDPSQWRQRDASRAVVIFAGCPFAGALQASVLHSTATSLADGSKIESVPLWNFAYADPYCQLQVQSYATSALVTSASRRLPRWTWETPPSPLPLPPVHQATQIISGV